MTVILMSAKEVERVRHLHHDFHPRHVFCRIVSVVTVTWAFGGLVVAEHAWGFLPTRLARHARLGGVASVGYRAYFAF